MLSDFDKKILLDLKNYADSNLVSIDVLLGIIKSGKALVDVNRKYETNLSAGGRVVYTIEEQPKGMCHHISISEKGRKPSYDLVKDVCGELCPELFGELERGDVFIYLESNEDFDNALNIILPYRSDLNENGDRQIRYPEHYPSIGVSGHVSIKSESH